jgi:hypothetical protein
MKLKKRAYRTRKTHGLSATTDLFLLSRAQMRRIAPFFPRSRGLPRVDDRRRTKGGLNSKLHAVCDGQGRPILLLISPQDR